MSSRNWVMTKTLKQMLQTKYIMMVAAQARWRSEIPVWLRGTMSSASSRPGAEAMAK